MSKTVNKHLEYFKFYSLIMSRPRLESIFMDFSKIYIPF